jgi:DNA-binding CsgD family transcriptional regulator
MALRADIAALICPDWRVASLVMDARSGQVTFANTPCLELLSSQQNIQIVSGRFTFVMPIVTDRFYAMLDRLVSSGLESATMMERDGVGAHFLAITIRNTQGFFRDVLNRSLGGRDERKQFVIVEFASSRDQSEWLAMRAFAQSFALSPFETELCDLILRGLEAPEIAALKMRDADNVEAGINGLLIKLGCKNTAQLVRLILTLCPPTRHA